MIWPNDELLNDELAGDAHWTMLSMFSTSRRTENAVAPPVLICLFTDRSMLLRHGENTPGRIRGALPTRVVGERNDYLATWLAVGTTIAQPILADGRDLHGVTPLERYTLPRASWIGPRRRDGALILLPAAAAHSIHAFPHGWYVNLEEAAVRWDDGEVAGVDMVDQDLDIWVTPDRLASARRLSVVPRT